MSRTSEPYDNALAESCIGTLKTKCAEPAAVTITPSHPHDDAYLLRVLCSSAGE